MATFAPSVARRLAIAAPMPRDPPVINAIFPSSFLFMILVSLMRFVDSLCIDRYKTRSWTKARQVIYLPIGMKSEIAAAPRGRPRAFDPEAALDRAMHVFWTKGYEGASLSNLTRAMRINRPSLYAAFGNKEELFLKVLDRYANGPLAYFRKALAAPKARDVVEQIFRGTAKMGDPAELARYVMTVLQGMAVQGANGAKRDQLRQVARIALRAWPKG